MAEGLLHLGFRLATEPGPLRLAYGSMVIVQVIVVGALMPVTVLLVSQPEATVLLPVPVALSQLIVADVVPEPPSRKLTWMSDVGVSLNEVASPTYGESEHVALLSTVTAWPLLSSMT